MVCQPTLLGNYIICLCDRVAEVLDGDLENQNTRQNVGYGESQVLIWRVILQKGWLSLRRLAKRVLALPLRSGDKPFGDYRGRLLVGQPGGAEVRVL